MRHRVRHDQAGSEGRSGCRGVSPRPRRDASGSSRTTNNPRSGQYRERAVVVKARASGVELPRIVAHPSRPPLDGVEGESSGSDGRRGRPSLVPRRVRVTGSTLLPDDPCGHRVVPVPSPNRRLQTPTVRAGRHLKMAKLWTARQRYDARHRSGARFIRSWIGGWHEPHYVRQASATTRAHGRWYIVTTTGRHASHPHVTPHPH